MARLPSSSIAEFRTVLGAAKHIIVVAGAGLSAASGVPTFRGAGGMWRSLNAMSLATPEAFEDNPSLVWQFYHYRREKALQAQPNAAHIALAKLSIPSVLEKVAPSAQSFHLITQNVDGLSTRAMRAVADFQRSKSSSPSDYPNPDSIIEMHGRLFDVQCLVCHHTVLDFTMPLCPALGEADQRHADIIAAGRGENEVPIQVEDLPKCVKCGSLTRPGVVWFGEGIPLLPTVSKIVDKADLCLVVGTSSQVYPAAGFAYEVQTREGDPGRVAVFNLEESDGSEDADFLFLGGCEVELPKALGVDGEIA